MYMSTFVGLDESPVDGHCANLLESWSSTPGKLTGQAPIPSYFLPCHRSREPHATVPRWKHQNTVSPDSRILGESWGNQEAGSNGLNSSNELRSTSLGAVGCRLAEAARYAPQRDYWKNSRYLEPLVFGFGFRTSHSHLTMFDQGCFVVLNELALARLGHVYACSCVAIGGKSTSNCDQVHRMYCRERDHCPISLLRC
jgi:hypothetical protein